MQPNDLTSTPHALAVLGRLVSTLLRGKRILKQAAKMFPEGTGAFLIKQLRSAYAYLVRESIPPIPYPLVGRAAKCLLSAYFYVQAFNCLALFAFVLALIMNGAAAWRLMLAVGFALLVSRMFWFCFTQAEKLRMKLRVESVILW